MFGVIVRRSLNLQRGAFTDLVFFLALMLSCRGQEMIGSSQPIVAMIGEDAVLPCHLNPAINAFDNTVEWARPDLNPRFVYVWRDRVELEIKKHPTFRGRTSMFSEELKHGNVSLKLSRVKLSDGGGYRCFIPPLSKSAMVQLVVGSVSSPVAQVTLNSSRVWLECESKGWFPEPEMFWLDGEGNPLSSGPTETVRGPDGLYTVSSRATVETRHSNTFTCRVSERKINQSRETHITVPDHFFMVRTTPSIPSTPDTPGSLPAVIGSVIGCLALVLILGIIFALWMQRRLKNRKDHEDRTEQSEEENMKTPRRDFTEFHVEKEGEEERAPLMSGREEEEGNETHPEDNGGKNQELQGENEVQAEQQQEDPKDQPEEQKQEVKVEFQERQKEGRRNETSVKNKKIPNQTRGEEETQAEQHLNTEEGEREQAEQHLNTEEREREQTEQHLNTEEREREQTEQHLNTEEREREQTEQHLNTEEREREKAEQHLNTEEREREQTEQHLNTEEREREQTEQHLNTEEREREQTEQHLNTEEREREQAEQHLNTEEREREQTEEGKMEGGEGGEERLAQIDESQRKEKETEKQNERRRRREEAVRRAAGRRTVSGGGGVEGEVKETETDEEAGLRTNMRQTQVTGGEEEEKMAERVDMNKEVRERGAESSERPKLKTRKNQAKPYAKVKPLYKQEED
ncbi:trichohyalin-like [Notolabrus celidotus]|uniref:trichohyalin-like n=1 Tax=Notolabrus celidotus TaxID=1203425 RepID=UPI00148FC189|nr:trichohyalin-like [Notolabrus celidotus]